MQDTKSPFNIFYAVRSEDKHDPWGVKTFKVAQYGSVDRFTGRACSQPEQAKQQTLDRRHENLEDSWTRDIGGCSLIAPVNG